MKAIKIIIKIINKNVTPVRDITIIKVVSSFSESFVESGITIGDVVDSIELVPIVDSVTIVELVIMELSNDVDDSVPTVAKSIEVKNFTT